MTKFLAGVLSVIAMGILLIAYSLLNLAASPFDRRASMEPFARPMNAGERMLLPQDAYGVRYADSEGPLMVAPYNRATYTAQPVAYVVDDASRPRPAIVTPAPRRVAAAQSVGRRPGRDWKKTALVIGGSTAGAAGLGAVFGGKKGALIGAAIGGGASTIYEATKR